MTTIKAGDEVRVRATADCGLDWTGPRRAWDAWFEDCHIRAHRKGRDGLSACCPGVTITECPEQIEALADVARTFTDTEA